MANRSDTYRVSRRHMLKAGGFTSLGIVASALAAACGSTPAASSPAATQPAQATTAAKPATNVTPTQEEKSLVFWQAPGHDPNVVVLPGIVNPWHEQHPQIKIDLQRFPFNEHYTKYQTVSAAGQAPDVSFISTGWMFDFCRLNILLNLDPYVRSENLFGPDQTGEFYLNSLDAIRYPTAQSGSIYGIPYNWQTLVLFYNKDVFDEANEPYPTTEWTYAKVAEVAERLIRRNGDQIEQYGITSHWKYSIIDPSIYSNGGNLLNEDYTRSALDDPANVATIQWWVDLVQKSKAAPLPADFGQGGPEDFFQTGRVGMGLFGAWRFANLSTQETFAWDLVTVPKGTQKQVSETWPDQHSVSAKSKFPDDAFEFCLFSIRPERPAETYLPYAPPFRKSVAYSDAWLQPSSQPSKKVILETGETAAPQQAGYRWTEWRNKVMDDELQPAYLGMKSVPEAVKAAHDGIQAVLDRP